MQYRSLPKTETETNQRVTPVETAPNFNMKQHCTTEKVVTLKDWNTL